jgi:hypothetical protein
VRRRPYAVPPTADRARIAAVTPLPHPGGTDDSAA